MMKHGSGLKTLVRANRSVNHPPTDARERNRKRLAARLAAQVGATVAASAGAHTAAAAVSGGAASGALAGGFVKWAVLSLAVVGGGAGVGAYVTRRQVAAVAASTPTVVVDDTPAVAPPSVTIAPAVPPDPQPASTPSDTASPADPPRGQPVPERKSGTFERELQLLRSARRALDAGSPAQALALLDRYAAEFPRGALKSEEQAARVQALCAAGNVASAQRTTKQFLEQHPGSPLTDRVRASCGAGR
jgi:hypothetical protein